MYNPLCIGVRSNFSIMSEPVPVPPHLSTHVSEPVPVPPHSSTHVSVPVPVPPHSTPEPVAPVPVTVVPEPLVDNVAKSEPVALPVITPVPGSLSGETRINTINGIYKVSELTNEMFYIADISGGRSPAYVTECEEAEPVYHVTANNGCNIYCSANQVFVTVSNSNNDNKSIITTNTLANNLTDSMLLSRLVPRLHSGTGGTFNTGYVMALFSHVNNGILSWTIPKCEMQETSINIITRWIQLTDQTIIGKTVDDETHAVTLSASNKQLRDAVTSYTPRVRGIPDSVWSFSEEFRHGYIDSLISHYGKLMCVADEEAGEKTYVIEFKSSNPVLIADVSDLIRMYGIVCFNMDDMIRIDLNTFSRTFHLTNTLMQEALNVHINRSTSQLSSTVIKNVEKTTRVEKMFRVNTVGIDADFRTCIGLSR